MLIQSLAWAPMISGRAGTIKPIFLTPSLICSNVSAYSVVSEWMSRLCSYWGTHQSQGSSDPHCNSNWDWRLCCYLPRVLSDHSLCVFSLPRWMKKPRCGVPDHPHLSRRRRNKRYALTGQKWRQKHITYRCFDFLSSFLVLAPPSFSFSWPEFQRLTP